MNTEPIDLIKVVTDKNDDIIDAISSLGCAIHTHGTNCLDRAAAPLDTLDPSWLCPVCSAYWHAVMASLALMERLQDLASLAQLGDPASLVGILARMDDGQLHKTERRGESVEFLAWDGSRVSVRLRGDTWDHVVSFKTPDGRSWAEHELPEAVTRWAPQHPEVWGIVPSAS